MSENKKSNYARALDALSRAHKKIDTFKETGETLMTEGGRTVVAGVCGFASGLADQRFGAADAETGIRVHKTNGAPTALLVAGGLKVASGLGAFGKMQQIGFAAADGPWVHSTSTWGRMAGERLRKRAEKGQETATTDKKSAKKAA